MEAKPHADHYRDLPMVTSGMRKRPTLVELHELDTAVCMILFFINKDLSVFLFDWLITWGSDQTF